MRGYLLDTHVILWWLSGSGLLPEGARREIADPANPVFVSVAAVWEMAIKKSIGRLEMPANLEQALASDHISVLPIGLDHALAVAELPALHGDPFDRLQIAQARIERLVLVTHDARIRQYDLEVLPV